MDASRNGNRPSRPLRSGIALRTQPPKLTDLRVEIFADGADEAGIATMAANPLIKGFTTNPTVMRKAGITDYEAFARSVIPLVAPRPISFEVFADDFPGMEEQAREIATWGPNVIVKVPITDTHGASSLPLVRRLARERLQLNVTALLTPEQVRDAADALADGGPSFVSVFAGRIADTGRDPLPVMTEAVRSLRAYPHLRLIWASPRELLNIFHADAVGCHVITVTNDVLAKLPLVGKDLAEYSLETVRMFFEDGRRAGYAMRTRSGAR